VHEALKFEAMIVFLNPNKLDRIEVYLDGKYSNIIFLICFSDYCYYKRRHR